MAAKNYVGLEPKNSLSGSLKNSHQRVGKIFETFLKGDKGDTPVITAQRLEHTITIYADGIEIAKLTDGEDGSIPVITSERSGTDVTIYADGVIVTILHDGEKGDSYVLTQADKAEIAGMIDVPSEIDDTAGTGDTDKTWSADKISSELESAGSVKDVTVNGASIVDEQTGIAEIPVLGNEINNIGNFTGLVSIHDGYCTGWKAVKRNNVYYLEHRPASNNGLRLGTVPNLNNYGIVDSTNHHVATFYGLAKAAGDTTQSVSANEVGTYTDEAKAAIKAMLDITGECQTVTVTGTTPVITATQNTRYVCGEVTSLDFTPSAKGICDVIFTSGSTVTVLTLPSTVILPSWFDVAALEANTTYEISISDGVYGAVMVWQ